MFCSQCGNPVREGDEFCGVCGAPVQTGGPDVPAIATGAPSTPDQPIDSAQPLSGAGFAPGAAPDPSPAAPAAPAGASAFDPLTAQPSPGAGFASDAVAPQPLSGAVPGSEPTQTPFGADPGQPIADSEQPVGAAPADGAAPQPVSQSDWAPWAPPYPGPDQQDQQAASQSQQPAPQPAPQPQPTPQSQPAPQPQQPYAAAGAPPTGVPPTGPAAPDGQYAAPQPPVPYMLPKPSPLSRAWADFRSAPNKGSILLKLALFQFVPGVGGIVLNGYTFHWGKEAALGAQGPLPHKIIRPGVLDSGLYAYGTNLIASLAVGLALLILGGLFGILNLEMLFLLLEIVFFVFEVPFVSIMNMRAAICGQLRSGFKLSEVWNMYKSKGKLGSLLALTWAPGAVVVGICFVLYFIFALIVAAFVGGAVASVSSGYGYYGYYDPVSSVISGILGGLVPLLLIVCLFCFVLFLLTTVANLVSTRAVGYWIADFAPGSWPEYQQNSQFYASRAL